jgi:hypothetical protein
MQKVAFVNQPVDHQEMEKSNTQTKLTTAVSLLPFLLVDVQYI